MWLVQRCTPKGTFKEGQKVSEFMSLDYMGSAEFEFGAIPKSIRRLAGKKNLILRKVQYVNKNKHTMHYTVLADEVDMDAAIGAIQKYLAGKDGAGRLKEWIHFRDLLEEEKQDYDRETFWWCVDEKVSNYGEQDDSLNFCWSLNPEQVRCFKLALVNSLAYMNAEKAKEGKS